MFSHIQYTGYVLLSCVTVRYPSTKQNDQNTLIVQSISSISWRKSGDTFPFPSSLSSILILLFWSGQDVIINARDPIQNPGQTHLTGTKCDPVDPDNPTQFQPCCMYNDKIFIGKILYS